jgi:electron transport complex protein RnfA
MRDLIVIFVSLVLVDNLVLVQGLGICPTVKLSTNAGRSLKLGAMVALAMLLTTAAAWPIEHFLLEPFGLDYFRILILVPVSCAIGFGLLALFQKKAPGFCGGGVCLNSLLVTNCAVLGLALQSAGKAASFPEALAMALGGGAGFVLVLLVFAGMRDRIDRTAGIPAAFRGIPSYLAAASVLSVVLTAFSGVASGLFS